MDLNYWWMVLKHLQRGNDVHVLIRGDNLVDTRYVKSKNTGYHRDVQIFVGSRMYIRSDISVRHWFLKADDVESIIDIIMYQKTGQHAIVCQSYYDVAYVDISDNKEDDSAVKLSLRLELRFSRPHHEVILYLNKKTNS